MIRPLLAISLAVALGAGEAPPAAAPVTIAIADGQALASHWDASLYGKVWNDPGQAWVRKQWAEAKAGLKQQGLELDAVLAAATGVRGEFLGMTVERPARPRLRLQADLGAQAAGVFAFAVKSALPEAVPVAGATEARRLAPDGPVLARHGTRLVLGWNCEAAPWPVKPLAGDARMAMDYGALMQVMAESMPEGRAAMQAQRQLMADFIGTFTWDLALVPQGLHEVMTYDRPSPGVLAVDRALLDRFPADALAVAGMGIDLGALWKVAGPAWIASLGSVMKSATPQDADAVRREVDAALAALGVAGGLDKLMSGIRGTTAWAVTPGTPIPGVSLVVPRSPELDALIAAGLARIQAAVPAEGATTVVPVPNLPVLISIGRDTTHWIASSDAIFIDAWVAGRPGGFLGSAAGKAAVAAAPRNAYALGALDTVAALRLLTPFAAMGLSQARGMPQEAKQAILSGLACLARESGPSWAWAADGPGQLRTEAHGPIGLGVMPIAMVAAIAIPNLLESRVAANEAATAATLKSGIFVAQVQFQAGGYVDQDEDGRGEYGNLAELSGRVPLGSFPAGNLRLLAGPLAAGDIVNGYHYRIDLPDTAGGAIAQAAGPRVAAPAAADAQETAWIAYAWPVSRENGRRMYAIGADGQVRSLPWDGAEPAWSAALGDGWGKMPTWPLHQR
jgi:hypothetical protein